MFSEAKRWDVKGKRYFDYPMKYYAEDTGLRNARLDFRDVDPSHAMENAIYNELVRRGCTVDVGVVPVVTVNSEGRQELRYHEIDFVVNKADQRVYIQSAYALETDEKRIKELKPFSLTGDSFRKVIVRNDVGKRWYDDTGILNISLLDFLLDPAAIG